MEEKEDKIIKPNGVEKKVGEMEKEKKEIFGFPFAFPDVVKREYTKRKNGGKKEKRLAIYEEEINKLISEAEQEGDGADVKKIVKDFLKSRKAKAISRLLDRTVKEGEGDSEKEASKLEKEEVELVEEEKDNIANRVNNLIEETRIKLGAAQVSGLILEEKLEKFERIFNNKLDELNGILKDGGGTDDSEAKLNEFYKELLKLKDTFFRQPKEAEDKQRKKIKSEKNKRKKEPKTKDKFYQGKENPADKSSNLEKDSGNSGQHFDFIDEEKEKEYEIEKASSFEEFYETIRKIGRMRNNSNNVISAEQIIRKIEITRKKLKEKSENFGQEDEKWGELWKKHLDLIPEICGIKNKTGKLIREEIYGEEEVSDKKKAESQEDKKEFTEKELNIIEVFKNYTEKFREKLEAEADWAGYSDEQKNDTIKIQTAEAIKLKLSEKKLFAGKENEVSGIILKSKI